MLQKFGPHTLEVYVSVAMVTLSPCQQGILKIASFPETEILYTNFIGPQ